MEPDFLSISPRTAQVWSAAAKKIAHRTLSGILIECPFEGSQPDGMLFGHLCPRHLVAKLQALAEMVRSSMHTDEVVSQRKRKRRSTDLNTYGDHEGGICQERKAHRHWRRYILRALVLQRILSRSLPPTRNIPGLYCLLMSAIMSTLLNNSVLTTEKKCSLASWYSRRRAPSGRVESFHNTCQGHIER